MRPADGLELLASGWGTVLTALCDQAALPGMLAEIGARSGSSCSASAACYQLDAPPWPPGWPKCVPAHAEHPRMWHTGGKVAVRMRLTDADD